MNAPHDRAGSDRAGSDRAGSDRVGAVYRAVVPLRWSDMDSYGHVNNARMVTVLEEARVDWLFTPGSATAAMAAGSVVADLHVAYRRQLTHADGPLEVLMWISRLRAADAVVRYEVRAVADAAGSPAVTASTQMVPFDLAAQRPRRFTPTERAELTGWVHE